MAGSASKAKGTKHERALCDYLKAWWPKIDRRILSGRFDKGDIINGPEGWTIEAKDHGRIDLPKFMREAEAESVNAGTRWYCAIVKARRGKLCSGRIEDAYFVMPLHLAAALLAERESLIHENGH